MLKLSSILLATFMLASCQSFHSVKPNQKRYIANIGSGALKGFIDDIARQTQGTANRMSAAQIEKKVLAYIKKKESSAAYGNWQKMGILDDQAKNIDNLYDDLPYMNKVHKWVTQNITDILPINPSMAESAYKAIVQRSGSGFNPYKLTQKQLQQLTTARASSTSPFESSHIREVFVKGEMRTIASAETRALYQQNYKLYKARVKNDPVLATNIHETIESAMNITKRTGHKGMGKGCKTFQEKASVEVLEMKANLDIYRAKIIEEKAFAKAGGPFDNIDDVASAKRLTTQEVDDATEEAFRKVLNYTDDEARLAVQRLKKAPCQVY